MTWDLGYVPKGRWQVAFKLFYIIIYFPAFVSKHKQALVALFTLLDFIKPC